MLLVLGFKVPLVVSQNNLGNFVFRERDIFATTYLSDLAFNNGNLVESSTVIKNDANHLIAHSRFGFRGQFRSPFF